MTRGNYINSRKAIPPQENITTPMPPYNQQNNTKSSSSTSCLLACPSGCNCPGSDFPPPLSPWNPDGGNSHAKQILTVGMIVLSCIVVGTLLFGILCAALRAYYLRRNNSRRANPPIIFGTQEDFFDENQGPVLDHHVWYINTVGLPQPVIDSIAVFKYKKEVGLIEGTDCSVCLSEFQEDESLRLLPKCCHAFHLSCIDTWLRSHTNCPLCRAPIIIGAAVAQASESEPNSGGFDSRNEIEVVNLENYNGEGANNMGASEARNGNNNNGSVLVEDEQTAEVSMKMYSDSDCRVLSDLAVNWRVVEEDTQPARRSVSLDSPAAAMIYNAVAKGFLYDNHQGNSDTQLMQSMSVADRYSGSSSSSSSICKLMKSSSIGPSLQKGPMSMKRSFSSRRKFSSFRHGRRFSVLPL